jgi:excinuclease ABC subunit B
VALLDELLESTLDGAGLMQRALDETDRRRAKQIEYNLKHGITPQSIVKAVQDIMEGARGDGDRDGRRGLAADEGDLLLAPEQAMKRIKKLEAEMYKHARNLEFEEAARLRDQVEKLRHQVFGVPGALAG